jgi:hypothetical protein
VSRGLGDAFRVHDELVACGIDRRFRAVICDDRVPLVYVDNVSAMSAATASSLGIAETKRALLIGGGVSTGLSVLNAEGGLSPDTVERVRSHVEEALRDGYSVVVAYAHESLVDLYGQFFGALPYRSEVVDQLHALDVSYGTLDEWFCTLPSRVRRTWRLDFEREAALDLEYSWSAPDEVDLGQVAALIAVNERRNGFLGDPRLTRWRIAGETQMTGEVKILTAIDRHDGSMVGSLLTRWVGNRQELRHIGIAEDFPERRDLYHSVCFVEPVRHAFVAGAASLEFGRAHGLPKRVRGCSAEDLTRLSIRPD